jgi:4-aminobutyrate aminotransferase-like enzyme
LSGVLTNDVIAKARPWADPSGSSSSYGGNALGAAAGAAALRAIDEEQLVENARAVGATMLRELLPLVEEYPFVGEVRGRGLFLAIELVVSKKTKEPLPKRVTERIYKACVERGLLSMTYAPRVRLQPALTIDEATAKNGIAVLREVFDLAKRERWWDTP